MAEEDQGREYLRELGIQECMGTGGMHTRGLRDLADGVARPLSIIFD